MNLVKRLIQEEEGQTYVEYAVLVALIAVGIALSANFIGDAINNYFNDVGGAIGNLPTG